MALAAGYAVSTFPAGAATEKGVFFNLRASGVVGDVQDGFSGSALGAR
jgi:hypothetical protein